MKRFEKPMNRVYSSCASIALVMLALSLCALPAMGQGFTFNNFSSTAGLTTNGNAGQFNGTVLRLNPALQGQAGSAWFNTAQPVSGGFTTSFTFRISNTGNTSFTFPADGLAFVIQNNTTAALGGLGGGIGYQGISNSLAVEFDTFCNSANNDLAATATCVDPTNLLSNEVGVQSCGTGPNTAVHGPCSIGTGTNPVNVSTSVVNLSDGNPHTVEIDYDPNGSCGEFGTGTLNVNLLNTGTATNLLSLCGINLATLLNLGTGGTAFVGFTGATGSFVENNDILSWQWTPGVSFTTPPQTLTQGQLNDKTFNDNGKINQHMVIQSDAMLNGAASMRVKFTEFTPAVFNSTRLNVTTAQSPNWSGGATPIPPFPGTTGTPIPSANNNVVIMEQICFSDAAGTIRIACNIVAGTTNPLIKLTSTYTGTTPPPNPGYFTASDNQNDWAEITGDPTCTGTTCSVSGGTKSINTDYFIGDKAPVITITSPANGATYLLNQPVAANYMCSDPNSPPNPVPSCTGTVANGSNIDTASTGSKTLTVSSTDAVGTVGSASVPYSVVDLPVDLDLFGFAPSTIQPGSNLTYFLAAVNFAQANVATGVVVTDTVPLGTTVVPGKAFFAKVSCSSWGCSAMPPQGTPCGVSGRVVTCNIGSLAPLNTRTGVGILIVVNVPATTSLNTVLTDTATVTSLSRDIDGDTSVSIKTTVSNPD